jgi:hypothetical protein
MYIMKMYRMYGTANFRFRLNIVRFIEFDVSNITKKRDLPVILDAFCITGK